MDSGYPIRLKFIDMKDIDKYRLRLLYSTMIKIINNQKVTNEEIETLVTDDISF